MSWITESVELLNGETSSAFVASERTWFWIRASTVLWNRSVAQNFRAPHSSNFVFGVGKRVYVSHRTEFRGGAAALDICKVQNLSILLLLSVLADIGHWKWRCCIFVDHNRQFVSCQISFCASVVFLFIFFSRLHASNATAGESRGKMCHQVSRVSLAIKQCVIFVKESYISW